MEKVLQGILQSEDEALKMENEARQNALEILTEARSKAANILDNAVSDAETQSEELLQTARDEAVNEANLQIDSKSQSMDLVRQKSQKKLNKAVDYIIERVVN